MDDKRAAQSPPAPPFRTRAQRDRAHRQTHRSLEPDCSRRSSRPDIRETAPTVREPPLQRSASLDPPNPNGSYHVRGFHTARVTDGKTRSEYMSSALAQIADIVRASFTIQPTNRTPITRSADHAFWGRAIPCSAVAEQRHKIIRNRVASDCQLNGPDALFRPAPLKRGSTIIGKRAGSPTRAGAATDTRSIPRPLNLTMPAAPIQSCVSTTSTLFAPLPPELLLQALRSVEPPAGRSPTEPPD